MEAIVQKDRVNNEEKFGYGMVDESMWFVAKQVVVAVVLVVFR